MKDLHRLFQSVAVAIRAWERGHKGRTLLEDKIGGVWFDLRNESGYPLVPALEVNIVPAEGDVPPSVDVYDKETNDCILGIRMKYGHPDEWILK